MHILILRGHRLFSGNGISQVSTRRIHGVRIIVDIVG